ncbi:hypothetical protein [Chitinophaga agrisoli]|nr:hypothetical protein [Chitinophaga agrisoli]
MDQWIFSFAIADWTHSKDVSKLFDESEKGMKNWSANSEKINIGYIRGVYGKFNSFDPT